MRDLMRKLRDQKGFTLVELLIVIAIIAVLAMVAVPRFMDMIGNSRMNACQANQGTLETALEQCVSQGILGDVDDGIQAGMIADSTHLLRPLKKQVHCPGDTDRTNEDYDWTCDIRTVTCAFDTAHNV